MNSGIAELQGAVDRVRQVAAMLGRAGWTFDWDDGTWTKDGDTQCYLLEAVIAQVETDLERIAEAPMPS